MANNDVILAVRERALWRVVWLLLVVPGGAVSQTSPRDLCTSPIMDRFGGQVFINNIPENIPVGTTVGNLALQGEADEISLTYILTHPALTFDPVSQNITTIAPLDREIYNFIDIKVNCRIIHIGYDIPVPVKITILDINDNAPEFIGAPYMTNISELMPVGTTVLSGISATDADADNWKITFEVVDDGEYSTYFAFPSDTLGNLILTKQLDYELVHSIELLIVAKDHHPDVLGQPQPQLNSTATAVIQLYDGDDQNPAFTSDSYLAYVTENSPVGSLISVQPPLLAYDQDLGLNATVNYSLVPDTIRDRPQSSYFDIDNATGVLFLKDDVLRRGEQFSLMAQATQVNNPTRYARTSLFVFVQAANENQPRFLQQEYVVSLVENVPVGSYVTTVAAIDNDVDADRQHLPPESQEGTILTYTFTNPLLVTDFTINIRSGVIETSQILSYEKTPRYNISVMVSDGKWFDYTYLVVELSNINNHNPVFESRVYRFQGHKDQNFYVGTVKATDEDADSTINYMLAENNTHLTLRPNGDLYVSGDVSSIAEDAVISLVVVALDNGSPPRSGVAVVKVTFGVGVGPVTAEGQTDLVVIIILGVLSGCLLLIIAVLAIYIYRNSVHPASPSHAQPYTADGPHIDAYLESSKSFERTLNELPTDFENTYSNTPDGVYKQNGREQYLAATYSDINMSRQGASVQENPFQTDNDSDPGTSYQNLPRGSRDGRAGFPGYSSQSLGTSHPGSSSYSVGRSAAAGMHAVNEIDYHTATEPMDNVTSATSGQYPTYSSQSGSDPSFRGSAGSLGTFKVGNSTQALVGAHTPPASSVGYRGKGSSSVSFIDDHQVNVYHPDNVIHPGRTNKEKPEITVYY